MPPNVRVQHITEKARLLETGEAVLLVSSSAHAVANAGTSQRESAKIAAYDQTLIDYTFA